MQMGGVSRHWSRGLLEKGSFQKCPLSRDSRKFEILSMESPQKVLGVFRGFPKTHK